MPEFMIRFTAFPVLYRQRDEETNRGLRPLKKRGTTMGCFRVFGGMAGYIDAVADQTTLTEKFNEHFDTEAGAVTRANEIANQLMPGGSVSVNEEGTDSMGLDDRLVGLNCRKLDGSWWINPEGIDFRGAAVDVIIRRLAAKSPAFGKGVIAGGGHL